MSICENNPESDCPGYYCCKNEEIETPLIGDDDICTSCGALIANTRRDDHVKFHEDIAELIGWARSAGEFLAKLFRTY